MAIQEINPTQKVKKSPLETLASVLGIVSTGASIGSNLYDMKNALSKPTIAGKK